SESEDDLVDQPDPAEDPELAQLLKKYDPDRLARFVESTRARGKRVVGQPSGTSPVVDAENDVNQGTASRRRLSHLDSGFCRCCSRQEVVEVLQPGMTRVLSAVDVEM